MILQKKILCDDVDGAIHTGGHKLQAKECANAADLLEFVCNSGGKQRHISRLQKGFPILPVYLQRCVQHPHDFPFIVKVRRAVRHGIDKDIESL